MSEEWSWSVDRHQIRVIDHNDAVRYLAVIDPEDREQVERLTGALVYSGAGKNDDNHWREVQAALREFANPTPPKPTEPTGLGAVVEDDKGNRWVRAFSLRLAWTDTVFQDDRREYADINAVRVLSKGVTDGGDDQ